MANKKPAKPSPMVNLWAMVKDYAVIDHCGDVLIMAVHIPTIFKTAPLLYEYFLAHDPTQKINAVLLWRDNEVMPSRLLFWFSKGAEVPYQCELASDTGIIAATIEARRELSKKGWLHNENLHD